MDKGKHLKRAEIKNKIILELMESPLSLSELKYRLKNKYNVSRLDVHYHLYDANHGLTLRKNGKVVIEDNGELKLNLGESKAVVKIIDYLSKDPGYGKRVKRFFNRAFLEAFMSPYGDYTFSEDYHSVTDHMERDEELNILVAVRNYVEGYENPDAYNPELGNKFIHEGLNFAYSVRGDTSIEFKTAYILKIMSIMRMAKALEKEDGDAFFNYELVRNPDPDLFLFADFNVYRMTNQTIKEFLLEAGPDLLLDFFNKVIKKSILNNESEYFTDEWVLPFTLKPLLELEDRVISSLLVQASSEINRIWNSTLKKWRETVMGLPPFDSGETYRELERKKKVEREKQLRQNDPVFKYWAKLATYDQADKLILEMIPSKKAE